MQFVFSPSCQNKKEKRLQRFFEVIPAATSWAIIIGMLALSFLNSLLAAALIIAFLLYWLLRLIYMVIFLVLSYMKLSIERSTDWILWLNDVDCLDVYLQRRAPVSFKKGLKSGISLWIHNRELKALKHSESVPPASGEILHLVIIPVIKEPREVLESTIAGLARSTFWPRQIMVVIALEERAAEEIKQGVRRVQQAFRNRFYDILTVVHPYGLKAEAAVKGANITYAAKQAARYCVERSIPFENVIVSCFDADTIVNLQYFVCLTYRFMVFPQRTRASFQPIPVYHNNIWDVPAFARVLDVGASFFQLVEATNPGSLVTFSSHSMSFKALVEVGFWPVDMISDDSAIFWKAFIHYDGNYRVVPLYTTVSMDIAAAQSWRQTFLNVYRQKRRWAWGIENFPIVMRALLKAKAIPLRKKLTNGFKLFAGHIAWATWPFLLGVISWLPAIFAGREFSDSVLYYSSPRIKTIIFNLASVGLLTTSIISVCLLPKVKIKKYFFRKILHFFEWLLVPLISIFLSAIPALDAQTRLMRRRYMEFWVTPKSRKK